MALEPAYSPEGLGTCHKTMHSGMALLAPTPLPVPPRPTRILSFFPEDILVSPALEILGQSKACGTEQGQDGCLLQDGVPRTWD